MSISRRFASRSHPTASSGRWPFRVQCSPVKAHDSDEAARSRQSDHAGMSRVTHDRTRADVTKVPHGASAPQCPRSSSSVAPEIIRVTGIRATDATRCRSYGSGRVAERKWFGTGAEDAHRFVLGLMGWMLQGLDDSGSACAADAPRARWPPTRPPTASSSDPQRGRSAPSECDIESPAIGNFSAVDTRSRPALFRAAFARRGEFESVLFAASVLDCARDAVRQLTTVDSDAHYG